MQLLKQLIVSICLLALIQNINAIDTATLCKGRYNGTLIADPTNCEKFYACVGNEAVEYNCDSNYHFDKNSLSCMSGSECSDLEIPPSCTDGSVKEDAENCYIFNVCVNGQYQKASCPIGYYFYAPSAACKLITYDANYKCNCVVPDHTLMANRYNCETFYLCEGREAILEHCSLGAYYNSTINACLTDVEGICLMQPTTSPVLQVKTELEKLVKTGSKSICEYFANSEISFHPYEDDCRKFFLCINGQVHVQQCPKNFYYDSTKNYCVLDTENRCQNAEPTDVEETNQDMDIETSLIAKSKSLNYIPVQNKLFARFMKY